MFKCSKCGSTTEEEAGVCCGMARDKVCACGSGKMAKECCEKPAEDATPEAPAEGGTEEAPPAPTGNEGEAPAEGGDEKPPTAPEM